jgi:hypothetical protein
MLPSLLDAAEKTDSPGDGGREDPGKDEEGDLLNERVSEGGGGGEDRDSPVRARCRGVLGVWEAIVWFVSQLRGFGIANKGIVSR